MRTLLTPVISLIKKWRKSIAVKQAAELYREQFPSDSILNRRFYNIGPGEFNHPYWTNIDGSEEYQKLYGSGNGPHIYLNLFDHKPLPVPDNTAELVYTSHTIEHIDNASVNYLFKEVQRVLKPGGIFRIVTPDTELAYKAWQRNDRRFYEWLFNPTYVERSDELLLNIPYDQASLAQVFLEEFASQASTITRVGAKKRISDEEMTELFRTRSLEEALDYCISLCSIEIQRQHTWRHINWFHENKLRKMLGEAGFGNIYRSAYLQSYAPVLRDRRLFDQTLPQHSLFMETVK
jgi:predicted SAM-dependent methyltransferase